MKKQFIPVNDLLAKTTLKEYVDHYGFQTEIKRAGQEERIQSPFPCEKCRGNGLSLSVNWPSGVFTSHCYHCSIRGRVTTLLYGMKYGKEPTTNPLKGGEFKDIAADIAEVSGYRSDEHRKPEASRREDCYDTSEIQSAIAQKRR
ncbi:MAG: hypothetical protein AAF939_08245 [Planctomycetota bacterium]